MSARRFTVMLLCCELKSMFSLLARAGPVVGRDFVLRFFYKVTYDEVSLQLVSVI
jgi:hypothetical protein